jgi:hypothetical protein
VGRQPPTSDRLVFREACNVDSIWQKDALPIFLAFFIPGFTMKKVYGMFVASDNGDWQK